MEVLAHGDRYEGDRRFRCWRCGCVFVAKPDEYGHELRKIKAKEGYTTAAVPVANCPECNYVVDLKVKT